MSKILTKGELLTKLRTYKNVPDDENIQYKEKIEKALLSCPELLYALNEEDSLYDESDKEHWEWDSYRKRNVPTNECRLNWEINEDTGEYEPSGDWEGYFNSNSNIRPFLFIPDTQTEVKHYICYQVAFDESPRYNDTFKYTNITFTIFVHGNDRFDKITGIPRHDLISSIIRERFNWSNIFGMHTRLISSKESTTDNNYIVRTLVFQAVDTNGIVYTSQDKTVINNYKVRR